MKQHSDAIAAYNNALRVKSDYGDAYFGLGNAYYNTAKYDEAATNYKQAVHSDPQWALAWHYLGDSYKKLKRFQDAIAAYKEAIRVKADYGEVHLSIGSLYAEQGSKD